MSRARGGNKSSKAAIAVRQAKEREMIEKNPGVLERLTHAEIAEAIGAGNRLQVQRDLQEISRPLQLENSAAFEHMKHAQLQTYELMERSLVAGRISPDIAREWRGIRSEISQLLGLNAPTKSVHMSVGSDSSSRVLKFKKASAGLSDAQLEAVFCEMAKVPREPDVTVRDASWFPAPEPKQLESGE